MKLAAPTCHFKTVKTQKEKIKHLYDAGFRNIDLTIYSIQAVEDIISDDWESFVYDPVTMQKSWELNSFSHTPRISVSSQEHTDMTKLLR